MALPYIHRIIGRKPSVKLAKAEEWARHPYVRVMVLTGLVINVCKTSAFVVSMYLQHWADAKFWLFPASRPSRRIPPVTQC